MLFKHFKRIFEYPHESSSESLKALEQIAKCFSHKRLKYNSIIFLRILLSLKADLVLFSSIITILTTLFREPEAPYLSYFHFIRVIK